MNKKAQVEIGWKAPYFIIALGVLLIMFIALMWLFGQFVSRPVITHEQVYVTMYKERFLDSPDCFAYQDIETGNVYSGIIDKSKFTEDVLNNCYKENKESVYEFSLTLEDGEEETTVQTENYRLLKKQIPMFVLIYDNGDIRKGNLLIGIEGVELG